MKKRKNPTCPDKVNELGEKVRRNSKTNCVICNKVLKKKDPSVKQTERGFVCGSHHIS
jgi:hypothetical protein